jgi:hypothetical protein
LLEVFPITHPPKKGIIAGIPHQEDEFPNPKGGLVNFIDGHKDFNVVEQKDIVEDGGEEADGAVQDVDPLVSHFE